MPDVLYSIGVLIVHADPEWRRPRVVVLRAAGAAVAEAAGPEEARPALARAPADVIIAGAERSVVAQLSGGVDGIPLLCLAPAGLDGADVCLPESAEPAALVSTTRALADLGRRARAVEEEARRCRLLLAEMQRWRTTLDAILYQLPSGVVVFNRDAEIILSNEAANQLLLQPLHGLFAEAFAAGPEVYRPDGSRYAPEEIPGMRALRRGETVAREEVCLRYPDGEERFAAISAVPLRDEAGEIIGAVVVLRDITERRQAEEEQAQQARLLEAIGESVPVGVAYLDRELRLVRMNSALVSLLGLPKDQAPGEGILPVLGKPREVGEALTRARDAGEAFGAREVPVVLPRRPEAGTRYLDIGGAPVKHEGEVEGMVVAVSDVTDAVTQRRQIEEAERAWAGEAGLLSTILENTDSWLAYLDRDLRFVRINQAFADGMGLRAELILGRPFDEVFPKSADLHTWLIRSRDAGKPQRFWGVPRRLEHQPSRGRVYLHMAFVPVRAGQGAVQGIVVSMVDVTQQMVSRQRMITAERARAEMAEHLGDEINHRVKNNLAMISGLLQMQLVAATDGDVVAALQEAVARVRTFSSLHEEMYASRAAGVEFLAVLRRVAAATQEVFAARGDIAISVSGEEVTIAPRAATNLSVIANELLTNAIKHGAPGEDGVLRVEVTLGVVAGYLSLAVRNSGNPVPPGFDVQANEGMGLRLVRDLVVTGYHGWFGLKRADGGTVAEVKIDAFTLRGGGTGLAEQVRREREGKPPL